MEIALPLLDGRYELSKQIGRGSTGAVWEARDRETSELVAVKLLEPRSLSLPRAEKRFLREVEAARALHHPHSVEVRAHGLTEDGRAYLVMERLVGMTLAARLRESGPLDQLRAIKIISQVLEAVVAAHRLKIVHRDLKPSNVMLVEREGDRDFVKVCDFGLAKTIESDSSDSAENGGLTLDLGSLTTEEGRICGTPEYMAPEQARGETLDARADLYAIAVVLFQCVIGQLPFSARSPLAVVSLHLTAKPPRPSVLRPDLGIFPALEKLILRGLAKDRAERPSSAEVFRAELLQIERDYARSARHPRSRPAANVPAESPTLPARMERREPTPQRSTLAPLVLAAVAVVLVSAAWRQDGARGAPVGAIAIPTAPAPSIPAPRESRAAPERMIAAAAVATAVLEPTPPAETKTKRKQPAMTSTNPLDRARSALAAGRVAEACALGEEASRAPGAPASVLKFLGQCYMRLGERDRGVANYRRYLETAPPGPDRVFIEEMIR